MTKIFLFILAVVNSDGQIETYHSFVKQCPTNLEVAEIMRPLKNSGEVIGWGGKCTAISPSQLGASNVRN